MNPSTAGSLSMYVGPMYSGKTSKLLELYKQFTFCKVSTVVINYAEDTRYSSKNMLSTHDKQMIECEMCSKLAESFPTDGLAIKQYKVILINEAQFFPDIVPWVKAMLAAPHNKNIYICGLDGDYLRNPFVNNWLELVAHSDSVHKLTSICCNCRNLPAIFSCRLTAETEQKVIGSDAYIPLCRECYDKTHTKTT